MIIQKCKYDHVSSFDSLPTPARLSTDALVWPPRAFKDLRELALPLANCSPDLPHPLSSPATCCILKKKKKKGFFVTLGFAHAVPSTWSDLPALYPLCATPPASP